MAFNRPTLAEIIERKITDFESRLSTVSAQLRRTLVNAFIRASAGVAHGLHGHLEWLSDQIIPDTAETDLLDRHAGWWGINRKSASSATGNITFTGTDTIVIDAGTIVQRADGEQFTTDANGTISGGSVDIAVTAVTAGQNSNTSAGVSMSLVTAIAGVDSSAVVAVGGLTGGADIEADDDLRERLRDRVQNTPHGGAQHDYVAWANEVAGVTRAWAFSAWLGPGTVGVYFVRDDDASLIPDAGEVQTVQDHIDSKRQVTADATVYAPTNVAQDMTIQISPNNTTVQAAIQAELEDLFLREAEVDDGAGSGTILISHVREAISIAAGEADNVMVSPTADLALSAGQISTLGTITWQSIP